MIPKIIHQTWKTKQIPKWARKWHQTWKSFHPEYQFYLWTDEENRELVKTHCPQFLDTYDSFSVHIQRVDSVRYLILYLYGGIYVDLDFECFKNMDPLLADTDLVLSYSSNVPVITNAIMMSKPRHPFWLRVLKHIRRAPPKKWYELSSLCVMRSTGPLMVHRVAKKSGLFDDPRTTILKKQYFFPFNMMQKKQKLDHFPDAYGAHQHMCTWTNEHHAIRYSIYIALGACILYVITIALIKSKWGYLWK
jgi:mannosyltransferase OCH1-like enzyme